MGEKRVEQCVTLALKNFDLSDYKIETEKTSKAQGLVGDLVFATVTGRTNEGLNKTLHLAVKISKDNALLREKLSMKMFRKEIFIYKTVREGFETFQREKGLNDRISFMPYCYTAVVEDGWESLVFEDLKVQEFELWHINLPMTYEHASLVLKAYGQWHALSVALKAQQPDIFAKFTENNVNMYAHVSRLLKADVSCAQEFLNAKKSVFADTELDILKLLDFSTADIIYAVHDMFYEESEDHVILHGDCWNNNFMFKTLDNPLEVRIVDWQCCGLGSPVFDLSHFIYCCCDTGKYQDIRELLDIYYKSFSAHLISYGCDPEKIFSFAKLLKHWKKFSRFGLIISAMIIKGCLNFDQFPGLEKVLAADQTLSVIGSPATDDLYFKRFRNNCLHYCKNVQ